MIDVIRIDMISAMKNKETAKKEILSLLLSALLLKAKEKGTELDTSEFIAVTKKEVKCLDETLSFCGEDKEEMKKDLAYKKQILMNYLPKELTEEEIREELIRFVTSYTFVNGVNKGAIMREFMPIVRGKAEGKVINKVVDDFLRRHIS